MRFISTYVHGMADYTAGLILIAAPWIFGFANDGPQTWVPVCVGIVMLGASLFTDYELGVVRRIPMTTHLGLDAVLGIVLAISPWLFGFWEAVWAPHVVFGALELGGAITTETTPTGRHVFGH